MLLWLGRRNDIEGQVIKLVKVFRNDLIHLTPNILIKSGRGENEKALKTSIFGREVRLSGFLTCFVDGTGEMSNFLGLAPIIEIKIAEYSDPLKIRFLVWRA
jgi:hypothetical protein